MTKAKAKAKAKPKAGVEKAKVYGFYLTPSTNAIIEREVKSQMRTRTAVVERAIQEVYGKGEGND